MMAPPLLSDIYSTWSHLELTLISDNLSPSCEWEVLNKLNSDHLPIITKFNINSQWKNKHLFIPKWNFKKANWSNFKVECNNINVDKIKNNSIDIFNDNLIKTITDIADKYIPVIIFSLITKINKEQNIKNCKIPLDAKFSNKESSFNEPFNLNEFNNAFIKRKCTATGPDNFSYLLLNNLLISRKPMTWSGGRGCYIEFIILE